MTASGEKRTRRKPLTVPSATIPGIEPSTTDSTPPLPGLPGAPVPARAGRRAAAKPAKAVTPAVPVPPVSIPAVPISTVSPVDAPAADVAQPAAPVVEKAVEVAEATASQTVAAVEEVTETVAETAEQTAEALAGTVQDSVEDVVETAASPRPETQDLAAPASDTFKIAARAAIAQQETTIMDTVQNTAEKTQAFFADANERTKGAMEKGAKFFQEMTEFGKGNVEAVVESSKIAARGFETLGQDTAAYLKTSFEDASQALRTLATIKSPTELMKFQADYLRSSFDAMVAQTSRGAEASLKLAGEVAQPISNRVAVAAEKMKVSA